jgi:hypothetical protein
LINGNKDILCGVLSLLTVMQNVPTHVEDLFFIEVYELLESLDVSTLEGGDIYFLGHSIPMMSSERKTCASLKK